MGGRDLNNTKQTWWLDLSWQVTQPQLKAKDANVELFAWTWANLNKLKEVVVKKQI